VAVTLVRALRAEGVPVGSSQSMPLGDQPVFASGMAASCTAADVAARQVIADSFVVRKTHLNPGAGPLLDEYAKAFEKVAEQSAQIADIAARAAAADRAPQSATS
jgi:perosamine synthetase